MYAPPESEPCCIGRKGRKKSRRTGELLWVGSVGPHEWLPDQSPSESVVEMLSLGRGRLGIAGWSTQRCWPEDSDLSGGSEHWLGL